MLYQKKSRIEELHGGREHVVIITIYTAALRPPWHVAEAQ